MFLWFPFLSLHPSHLSLLSSRSCPLCFSLSACLPLSLSPIVLLSILSLGTCFCTCFHLINPEGRTLCLHWGVPYTVHLYKYRLNTITVWPLRPLRPEIAWESQARDLWSPESITFLQAGGTEALCVQRLQFSLRWCPLGSGPGVHDASTVYTRWGYCHCRLGIMR